MPGDTPKRYLSLPGSKLQSNKNDFSPLPSTHRPNEKLLLTNSKVIKIRQTLLAEAKRFFDEKTRQRPFIAPLLHFHSTAVLRD